MVEVSIHLWGQQAITTSIAKASYGRNCSQSNTQVLVIKLQYGDERAQPHQQGKLPGTGTTQNWVQGVPRDEN
jgi:hypothetical protein